MTPTLSDRIVAGDPRAIARGISLIEGEAPEGAALVRRIFASVLFIIGLAVSVVTFSASRLHEKSVFSQEARKIYQVAKRAKESSLLKRQDVALRVSDEGNGYRVDYGSGMPSETYQVYGRFIISGNDILFFPKGDSSGGAIKLENNKGQGYLIEVDKISGAPSIKRF